MADKAKEALEEAKNNPNGWKFNKLCKLYEHFGFRIRSANGSHYVATHEKLRMLRQTFVFSKKELPPEYIKDAVKLIDELLRREGEL